MGQLEKYAKSKVHRLIIQFGPIGNFNDINEYHMGVLEYNRRDARWFYYDQENPRGSDTIPFDGINSSGLEISLPGIVLDCSEQILNQFSYCFYSYRCSR